VNIEQLEIEELNKITLVIEHALERIQAFQTKNERALSWAAGAEGKLQQATDEIDAAISELEN